MSNKINKSSKFRKNQWGLSIIELLIAVFIGLILITGLLSVFETTSNLNRTQNGLARLQENGRYATLYMRQNIEQAGYQYCLGSSLEATDTNNGVNLQPIVVYTDDLSSGLPNRSEVNQTPMPGGAPLPYLVDPSYLMHGHECSTGSCSPSLTSLGSQTTFPIPNIGVANGDRIEGTDVLTIRYYSDSGVEIDSVATSGGNVVINYLNPIPALASLPSGKVIIANCTGPSRVVELDASTANGATATISSIHSINFGAEGIGKLFDLDTDAIVQTFFVANEVVDGRDIPTLYSVINGTKNAIVQGVDRFDVKYFVKLASGDIQIFDADGVEGLAPANCIGNPSLGSSMVLNNGTGCGWRSVVSIELHLLLNTIYNSSTRSDEMFVYSIDGQTPQAASALPSGIEHYQMFRHEFMTSITMKNY